MLKVISLHCLLLLFLSAVSYADNDIVVVDNGIVVKAIFKNMVVVEYKGVRRTIKAGEISPEGLKLISATTKTGALVEVGGKKQTLQLSRQVGGGTYTPPEKSTVRVVGDMRGHFITPGRINNLPVSFLVDTGATTVALNSVIANRLGINYLEGTKVRVSTANGIAIGYSVFLNSVSVGNVTVNHVEAIISDGDFPQEILLGNSYLSRVDFKVDSGVLVLESRL